MTLLMAKMAYIAYRFVLMNKLFTLECNYEVVILRTVYNLSSFGGIEASIMHYYRKVVTLAAVKVVLIGKMISKP